MTNYRVCETLRAYIRMFPEKKQISLDLWRAKLAHVLLYPGFTFTRDQLGQISKIINK